MQAFGFKASDFIDDDTVHVWSENWPAVDVFIAMGTQWRAGPSGATGLDYVALPTVLRLKGIPRKDWPGLFESVQVMEYAALEELREQ